MLSKLNCSAISRNKNKYMYAIIECVQKLTNHKKTVTTTTFVVVTVLCLACVVVFEFMFLFR